MVSPVVFYGCEIWSLEGMEEHDRELDLKRKT